MFYKYIDISLDLYLYNFKSVEIYSVVEEEMYKYLSQIRDQEVIFVNESAR